MSTPTPNSTPIKSAPLDCYNYFFFGKHYGKSYAEVLHTDPHYSSHLEYFLRLAREDPETGRRNPGIVRDMMHYLTWCKAQKRDGKKDISLSDPIH